jgi:hypothetical protein
MTSILLAWIDEISAFFQWVEAASVTARWTIRRVNRMTVPCGSISIAA